MTTQYALTLNTGPVITIDRVTGIDNAWTIEDVGTTTVVIGRVFPIGRSTGTKGRVLTLDHIIKRYQAGISSYDDMHTQLETIAGYWEDVNNPVFSATLTGPNSLNITVRVTRVEFREPQAPFAPLGYVRFSCERVSN